VEVHRRHPLEWVLRDLQREGLVERIDVRRLGESDTHDLIAGFMGEEDVSTDFTHLVYGRTDGNPFFVQQVLRVLVERGDVFRREAGSPLPGRRWDRRSIEELTIPESIRSVVGQRLTRLNDTTQQMLQEASVLGETFTFADLQSLSGRPEAETEAALDEAINAGLVVERGRDRYAFDHALTRGALDAELSSRRRRRLHLTVGEALEALPERKRQARAAELAWHFLEGDEPARALRWSLAAGDAAAAVFAHSDAEGQFRTALQLAEEEGWEEEAQAAREKLGRALVLLSRNNEALDVFDAAVGRYRAAGDTEGEMRVLAEIAAILFDQGQRAEGLARAEPVLDRWRQDPTPSRGACALLLGVAALYWHAGRMDDALDAAQQAVDLASQLGDDRLLGRSESRLGVLLSHVGRSEEALAAYSRAIPISERAGDLRTVVSALNNRALIHGEAGAGLVDASEASADLERALELARKVGTPETIGWQLVLQAGAIFVSDGDWPRARALLDELPPLEPFMKGTRSAFHVTMARRIRLHAEHDCSMIGDLERLAEEGKRTGDALLWAGAQMWLAQVDVLEGRAADAVARCLAVHEHPEVEEQFRRGVDTELAWAYVQLGEYRAAHALIQKALTQTSRHGSPYQRIEWLVLLGHLRSAEGRWDDAAAAFEQALTLAGDAQLRQHEAIAMWAYGEMLVRRGDPSAARARLEAALDLFQRVHALYYAHLVERTLASLPAS
jgi:tetratricopeptide (TPR) repeat protein